MDIDAANYSRRLLGILTHISEADFVSFDLELTGIPSRLPNKEPWKPRGGKKTLEDRYAETKLAADRYHILQVGITCAKFDYQADKYILRPYNIFISPLVEERLDIEREVCIQTGAASFLLSHGFDMGAPWAKGVQYLSREEAQRAKQAAYDRFDKKNIVEDVQLKVEDVDSLDFVKRARKAIVDWKARKSSMLEITSHTGLEDQPIIPVISRFEKRLVHQLVRAEFPDLVTMGRSECIRIITYDEQRETENIRRMKRRVKGSIAKQTGFRWIFEALAQGDIHEVDPFHHGPGMGDFILAADNPDIKERFDRVQERLRTHQPVLVGHNMFTDLVYFYRSFVGPLPDTREQFCEAIHEQFPRIIDTKYLATHAEGDLNASPALQEIAEKLADQPLPVIEISKQHDKYHGEDAYHEAGFDSLLTATIMLRLSAKLKTEHNEAHKPAIKSDTEQSFPSAQEKQGASKNASPKPDAIFVPVKSKKIVPKLPNPSQQVNRALNGQTNVKKSMVKSTVQLTNRFDSLRLDQESEQEDEAEEQPEWPTSTTAWQDQVYQPDTSSWAEIETVQRKPMEMIPPFDNDDFWNKFGNTLRIYGTEEKVLKIAAWVT